MQPVVSGVTLPPSLTSGKTLKVKQALGRRQYLTVLTAFLQKQGWLCYSWCGTGLENMALGSAVSHQARRLSQTAALSSRTVLKGKEPWV